MTEWVRRHLTYGNVVATIALFAALGGGTAWALDRGSVKSRHIARNAVKGGEIAPRAVKSSDIAPNAVKASDLAASAQSGTVGGIVNGDGSTQVLSEHLSVSRVGSGKYAIKVPTWIISGAPVVAVTIISDKSDSVKGQTVKLTDGDNDWLITLQLSGGDHLFEFVAIEP